MTMTCPSPTQVIVQIPRLNQSHRARDLNKWTPSITRGQSPRKRPMIYHTSSSLLAAKKVSTLQREERRKKRLAKGSASYARKYQHSYVVLSFLRQAGRCMAPMRVHTPRIYPIIHTVKQPETPISENTSERYMLRSMIRRSP